MIAGFSVSLHFMSLQISSLNSGSNGNCYYVGNQQEAVLIDAGLSCRETEIRLTRSGLSIKKVKAVFITHEHLDHTRGASAIARKHKIPVYISAHTYHHSRWKLHDDFVKHFDPYQQIDIGGLSINPFPKLHDAADPFSFTVSGNGVTVGVLTDIGSACEHVIRNFSKCHAVFLESNYDEEMLENGSYPVYLKARIRSDHGHLSNHQSLELFLKHRPAFMSHVLLSHLSQDNNNPQLVEKLFKKHAGAMHVSIASRHRESPVFHITGEFMQHNNTAHTEPAPTYAQSKLF